MKRNKQSSVKGLFDAAYGEVRTSHDFVDGVINAKDQQQRTRSILVASTCLATLCILFFFVTPQSSHTESEQWTTDLDVLFEEHELYLSELLDEEKGLDEFPSETYAFIELIDPTTKE